MSLHSLLSEDTLQRFTFYVNGTDSVCFTKCISKPHFKTKEPGWQLVIRDHLKKPKARQLYKQLKANGATVHHEHNNHYSWGQF